jgi:hypothetical protein
VPPSVGRYDYEDKDQFAQIRTLERERLLDSMPYSREIVESSGINGEDDVFCDLSSWLLFAPARSSIDVGNFTRIPTTFNQDFLSLDTIPIPSIRTSFDPNTEALTVKMVTLEHTQVALLGSRVWLRQAPFVPGPYRWLCAPRNLGMFESNHLDSECFSIRVERLTKPHTTT